jgi:hypothetical protein
MAVPLEYRSPGQHDWHGKDGELSWEQAELNAGARRIYAARRNRMPPRFARRHPGDAALPAAFAPRPLALPAPPPPGSMY